MIAKSSCGTLVPGTSYLINFLIFSMSLCQGAGDSPRGVQKGGVPPPLPGGWVPGGPRDRGDPKDPERYEHSSIDSNPSRTRIITTRNTISISILVRSGCSKDQVVKS